MALFPSLLKAIAQSKVLADCCLHSLPRGEALRWPDSRKSSDLHKSWRVSNAALGDAALVLSSKKFEKIFKMGGSVEK